MNIFPLLVLNFGMSGASTKSIPACFYLTIEAYKKTVFHFQFSKILPFS